MGAVGFLVAHGVDVYWLVGSGARVFAPTYSLNAAEGAEVWRTLATTYHIPLDEPESGVFLKEFRNKAFRDPLWMKSPLLEERLWGIQEGLWEPEQRFVSPQALRFSVSVHEMDEHIRKALIHGQFQNLKRVSGVPLQGVTVENQRVSGVILGSGEKVPGRHLIYADRWGLLPGMEGLPRPLPFLRKREAVGVLQVSFRHHPGLQVGISQTFYAPMNREAGDQLERHFWGYFSSDGKQSVWTFCLSSEEGETNHEITKKLRKLKSGLDKIFQGSDIIPADQASFVATLVDEQVRFEEEAIFAQGVPLCEGAELPSFPGVTFLTDGYGPAFALEQVGRLVRTHFGIDVQRPHPQSESMNLRHPEAV
jgi:hypothetical protein